MSIPASASFNLAAYRNSVCLGYIRGMSKIGIFYVEMLSDLNSKFLRSSVVLELKLK